MDPKTIFGVLRVLIPTIDSVVIRLKQNSGTITEQELFDETDERSRDATARWKEALEE